MSRGSVFTLRGTHIVASFTQNPFHTHLSSLHDFFDLEFQHMTESALLLTSTSNRFHGNIPVKVVKAVSVQPSGIRAFIDLTKTTHRNEGLWRFLSI